MRLRNWSWLWGFILAPAVGAQQGPHIITNADNPFCKNPTKVYLQPTLTGPTIEIFSRSSVSKWSDSANWRIGTVSGDKGPTRAYISHNQVVCLNFAADSVKKVATKPEQKSGPSVV